MMKYRTSIRRLAAVLAALLLLSAAAGCTSKSESDDVPQEETGPASLWIVTEATKSDAMNEQIQQQIKEFRSAHKDVEIKLDILPWKNTDGERDLAMEQLRPQIMAGKGPDIFLLSTGPWVRADYDTNIPTKIEPLFHDAMQSMYNGLFADLSAYYDADDDLGKEAFAPGIMDAGVLDGARYILPIRYEFPVVYFERKGLTELGLDVDHMLQNVNTLTEELLANAQKDWPGAYDLLRYNDDFLLSLFSPVFDYETASLQIDEAAWTHYLEALHQLYKQKSTDGNGGSVSVESYIRYQRLWNTSPTNSDEEGTQTRQRVPLAIASSSSALDAAVLNQALGLGMEAVPLRSIDGSVVANVTYWGAVGAGCTHPKLAYQFLREFLLEDTQWELDRSRPLDKKRIDRDFRLYTDGYIASGLPVRVTGAVEPLMETLRYNSKHVNMYGEEDTGTIPHSERRKSVLEAQLTQDDVPVLNTVIDRAEFAPSLVFDLSRDFGDYIFYDGAQTGYGSVQAFVQDAMKKLEWHISEG